LCDAISADYGHRSRHETLLAEMFPAVDGIDHALKHLRGWMKPQRRAVDWRNFFGARNRVIPQPLGVVGVIVPWNFPLNLSLVPLTYIFAAGNRAMVKMSENSRHLARLLIERCRPTSRPKSCSSSTRPAASAWRSPSCPSTTCCSPARAQTGRAVMAAAARNLCPVTLELGGKAPAIVCDDFPLRTGGRAHPVRQVPQRRPDLHHGGPRLAAASRIDEFVRLRARSCRRATPGWIRPTTPRSSTSARSTACSMRWTTPASAAPR
jgi:coniferyl-aldehyde dehydrogenase